MEGRRVCIFRFRANTSLMRRCARYENGRYLASLAVKYVRSCRRHYTVRFSQHECVQQQVGRRANVRFRKLNLPGKEVA